jgi:hypothetical protein
MKGNPVGWFEIYVNDMRRARAFYEAVLGVSLKKMETPASDVAEMWAFPMQREGVGASGALVRMSGDGPSGGSATIVYFTCDDCSVEAGRVVPNGGKVMKHKFSIGQYGFIALVQDVEGNVIGLHSMR